MSHNDSLLISDVIVQFFFGVKLQAQYLPWVLCLFNMIVKGGGMIELIGIFVGHVYYFLKFRYSQEFGGPNLLETPQVHILNDFHCIYTTSIVATQLFRNPTCPKRRIWTRPTEKRAGTKTHWNILRSR